MANGDSLDVNSMYSILKNIFNREYNEGYANRNRSNFAGGLADLRNGWAAMQNARKNRQDQEEYRKSMGKGKDGNNNTGTNTFQGINGLNSGSGGYVPQGTSFGYSGIDGDLGSIGASITPQGISINPYDSSFSVVGKNNNESILPINGIQGKSVMDQFGNTGGKESVHGMNITDQTMGQNYNNRINSQYGADKSGGITGMNFPQTPQGNGGFNSVFNGANANPSQPSNSLVNSLAQSIGGNKNVSANDISQYLGNEYNRARWIQNDMANNGVTNPLISMLRYDTKIAPLINAAKEEELRNAFFTLNNPNASEQDRMKAMALIEFRKGDPFLEENYMEKLGLMPSYLGSGISGGGNGSGEYGGDNENARAIYSHLASKGLPANVIAGIMGNFQAESNFDHSAYNPNDGDGQPSGGIGQWHGGRFTNLQNFAAKRGTQWNDLATQMDFLLDEINNGYPDLLQKMANMSPEDAAILFHDVFERSNDTPEMKARRGRFASEIFNGRRQGNRTFGGNSGNSRWVQIPNRMTPMQRMQYQHGLRMDEIAARNGYRTGNRTRGTGTTIKDMTDKEYSGITSAISALNAENGFTPENGGKLASSLINEYRRAFDMAGDQYGAAEILYKSLMNGSKFGQIRVPDGINKEEKVAAIVADAVSQAHRQAGMAQGIKDHLLGIKSVKPKQGGNETGTGNQNGNGGLIKPPTDTNTVTDEESAAAANNNSFWGKFGRALDRVGNMVKVDKDTMNKKIGGNQIEKDLGDTHDSIVKRNREENEKAKAEYRRKQWNSTK